MSYAGMPTDGQQPMTWQDFQRLQQQQNMARTLLSQPAQQGPYGGLANAGNDIAGAMLQRSYMDQMKKYFPNPTDTGQITNSAAEPGLFGSIGNRLGNLFSLGGSQ